MRRFCTCSIGSYQPNEPRFLGQETLRLWSEMPYALETTENDPAKTLMCGLLE